MSFDITTKGGQLVLGEQALALMEQFQQWEVEAQEHKNVMEEFKQALQEAMEATGTKKWDIDTDTLSVVVNYIGPQVRKTVDTAALKEQGLYEAFTKETTVAPTVRIKFR